MKNENITELYWPILAISCWLAAMHWVWTKIGFVGLAWGLPASILITLPVAASLRWLDRWAQGRPALLLSAFAWGASVAGFCSIWSQEGLQALVDAHAGAEFGKWFGPLVITPVTEELFKGLFLVWMLLYRRAQFRGLLDGIVYGGLIGAGFAFSEQSMYFGQVIIKYLASDASEGTAGITLVMSLILRGVMVPFMHPFFVAFIGLGVAMAAGARRRSAQGAFILLGFLFPIALHGLWDWAALAGSDPFLIYKIYAAVMVPLFLALTVCALVLRRRRGKVIAAALPGLARTGHIGDQEIAPLGSLKERRRWRGQARRRAGQAGAALAGRYQAEASALALLSVRASAVGKPDDVAEQQRVVSRLRAALTTMLAS